MHRHVLPPRQALRPVTMAAGGPTGTYRPRHAPGFGEPRVQDIADLMDRTRDLELLILVLAASIKGIVKDVEEGLDALELRLLQASRNKFFESLKTILKTPKADVSVTRDDRLYALPGLAAVFARKLTEVGTLHTPREKFRKLEPALTTVANYAHELSKDLPRVHIRPRGFLSIGGEILKEMASPVVATTGLILAPATEPYLRQFAEAVFGVSVELLSGSDILFNRYTGGVGAGVVGGRFLNALRYSKDLPEALQLTLGNLFGKPRRPIAQIGDLKPLPDEGTPSTPEDEIVIPEPSAAGPTGASGQEVRLTDGAGYEVGGMTVGPRMAAQGVTVLQTVLMLVNLFRNQGLGSPEDFLLYIVFILLAIWLFFTFQVFWRRNDPGTAGYPLIDRELRRGATVLDVPDIPTAETSSSDSSNSWKVEKDGNALWKAWEDMVTTRLEEIKKKMPNKTKSRSTPKRARRLKRRTKLNPAAKRSKSRRKSSRSSSKARRKSAKSKTNQRRKMAPKSQGRRSLKGLRQRSKRSKRSSK